MFAFYFFAFFYLIVAVPITVLLFPLLEVYLFLWPSDPSTRYALGGVAVVSTINLLLVTPFFLGEIIQHPPARENWLWLAAFAVIPVVSWGSLDCCQKKARLPEAA